MSKKAFIHNDGVFFCIPHRDNEMPGCDMQNLVYQWDLPFFFFFFKWWVYILFTRLPTCTLLMSLLGYIDYIDSYGCYNSFFFFGIVFVFFLHSVGPYNFFLETFINSLYELSPSILGCRGRGVAQWFFSQVIEKRFRTLLRPMG